MLFWTFLTSCLRTGSPLESPQVVRIRCEETGSGLTQGEPLVIRRKVRTS